MCITFKPLHLNLFMFLTHWNISDENWRRHVIYLFSALFQFVSTESREYEDMKTALTSSYIDANSAGCFTYSNPRLVHSELLEKEVKVFTDVRVRTPLPAVITVQADNIAMTSASVPAEQDFYYKNKVEWGWSEWGRSEAPQELRALLKALRLLRLSSQRRTEPPVSWGHCVVLQPGEQSISFHFFFPRREELRHPEQITKCLNLCLSWHWRDTNGNSLQTSQSSGSVLISARLVLLHLRIYCLLPGKAVLENGCSVHRFGGELVWGPTRAAECIRSLSSSR